MSEATASAGTGQLGRDDTRGGGVVDRVEQVATQGVKAAGRFAGEYGGEAYARTVAAGRAANKYVSDHQWPLLLAAGVVGVLIGYMVAPRRSRW